MTTVGKKYRVYWVYGSWENNDWEISCKKLFRDFIDIDEEIEKNSRCRQLKFLKHLEKKCFVKKNNRLLLD